MTETKTNDFLERESLGKLMGKYSIPCVISLLVAALYNIVDQIFIANADYLGSFGNAANTVVFPLTVVALAIATMIGDGCCTFVSISLGAKEKDNAKRGIGSSIISVIAAGLVLMAIYLIFQETILNMFGANVNEETFRLSKEYFFWITLGIPFYMFGQALNPIIRSDGGPRFAMITLLVGAVINIILDPIFIFGFRWGMMGAAVATILGQIVSALMSLWYLFRMKAVKLDRESFRFDSGVMKKILPLGMTSFLSQISIVFSMAAVLNMVTKYGALDPVFSQPEYAHIPTAVVGIVMKFFQIIISIAVGLSAGVIPVSGYNVGAKRYDRVRGLMKLLITAEAGVGLVATIIFMVFPVQLTNLFGAANESVYYMDFSVKCFRIFLSMTILSCVNKGTFIFLQSLGKAKTSTVLSMMREIVFGVGLPILLPVFWGLDGVLLFMPVADILTGIASVCVIMHTNKMLHKEENMNANVLSEKKMKTIINPNAKGIITIGRSYGSGGRTVGKLIAEQLGIPYYDSELLERAAQKSGLSKKFLESMDEKAVKSKMLYSYTGFTSDEHSQIENVAAKAQREIIEQVAEEGACVIVGRRADQILIGRDELFRIFITAPFMSRVKRIMKRDHLTEQESIQKVKKVDKERAAYYNQYSQKAWGIAGNYELCIDTDKIGIQESADMVAALVKKMNH